MNNIFNPPAGASFDATGKMVEGEIPATVESPTVETTSPDTPSIPEKQNTEPPAAPASPSSDIDWGAVLAERTGGKYKTWEEISGKLSEESPALTFSNDESKKIFEYLKEGKVDDVLQVYNEQKRLSSLKDMSDAEVVKLAMEFKHATLQPDDIQDEFLSKYSLEKPEPPVADDYLDDDAFAKAEKTYEKELKQYEKDLKGLDRKLKLEAADSREYLSSLKKDIVLPDINPVEKVTAPDPAETERAKQFRDEYLASLNKSYDGFKEIPLKVTDEGISFDGKFEIDEAERLQLKKDLTEKNVFDDLILSRYIKEDSYDTKQLMEDLYWLNNKEKIIASAIKQALSKGKLDKIKETKNVDLDSNNRENFTPSDEVLVKEFSSNFLKTR
jgi:hypothetical protein